MFAVNQILCMGYLCVLAVIDIKFRRLPVSILALGILYACGFQIITGNVSAVQSLAGAGVGICFLGISKVTEEAFGYGDSLLILMLGICLGLWNLMFLLINAFLLSAVISVIALLARKFHRKTQIPFVPFLAMGYGILMIVG